MRIYLDVCSLNRPYDDQSIERNRLESEAVLMLMSRVHQGQHYLVSSEIIDREVAACPDLEKAELVRATLQVAEHRVILTAMDLQRARKLMSMGFRQLDSLHLACAEAAKCKYFITTDDKLIKRAKLHRKMLSVDVLDPLTFVMEVQLWKKT